jgi:hypothetical protein
VRLASKSTIEKVNAGNFLYLNTVARECDDFDEEEGADAKVPYR